ncbi:MAG TPA: non-ribosomal peptide synthetase [Candidatus Binatus sp.]|nr:non-ribosomal peptide synthetase [Candidatus Binatus sp.]
MSRQPDTQQRGRSRKRGPGNPDGMSRSLTARFEQQVSLHGERIAIKSRNCTLTYDELNRAANRLARAIESLARPDQEPIALLFKHSAALLTANLAVLKTGRPFVQIDDKLLHRRAARVLEDAGARLIITDGEHYDLGRKLAVDDHVVLDVDALPDDLADSNLGLSIAPTTIAYINYTSGSTGEPKGVMSDHGSELHSILVKAKALAITPADRISLLRSHNVGATSDALLGLLNGAALCLLELKEEALAGLAEWLINEDVTVFTCVASVFRHMLRDPGMRHEFPRVRIVHVGGEPLFQSDVALFRAHFADGCRLVNRLGISETKTASYYFLDKKSAVEESVVPVGFALDGYEIAVLDEQGKPAGANCVGEIAVKSRYLACGYWRRPELTQAKFVADPVDSGARVFLSGDLGYLRLDGCLVHVGRKDFQTKIRGHRVELAEVEIALLDIARVRQAAVVTRERSDGSARLLAYVAFHDEPDLTVSQLRAALEEKLPNYMIPAAFIVMARLPITASGKIDRRALPEPARSRAGIDVAYAAPLNELERVLAGLWCEVLEIGEAGRDDDFAALGGDSLLATRIVARVNQLFPSARPLKTLFATPTVAQLAAWITAQEKSPGAAAEIARLVLQIDAVAPERVNQVLDDLSQKENG